ncbi:TIGR01777 family oxidoreductase [Methylosoma difficile]
MKILITGGSGFLGSTLCQRLLGQSHTITVVTRNEDAAKEKCGSAIATIRDLEEIHPEDSFDVLINLAGEPIFGRRWSAEQKKRIRNSRIELTEQLVRAIARMRSKPQLLISGSAIGFYGDQGDATITEQSPVRTDFSQQLCVDWEMAARQTEKFGVRVCLIRTGLVLGKNGGLLEKMLIPFLMGLGGQTGNGKQWMSWIHRDDWATIIEFMINNPEMRGAYNAVAPNPVTNAEFTQTLASIVKRPALLPLPSWLLKIGLGEMAGLILGSQKVLPDRLLKDGFQFAYLTLESALISCLKK